MLGKALGIIISVTIFGVLLFYLVKKKMERKIKLFIKEKILKKNKR